MISHIIGNMQKEAVIEEIPAITSIEQLPNPTQTAISIITPPSVTLGVLEKAKELGIKSIWIQPGGEDKAVLDYAKASGLDIIAGGPCLLVDGPHLLANRSQLQLVVIDAK